MLTIAKPGTIKGLWKSWGIPLLIAGILLISVVVYKYPTRLEFLLPKEISGADNIEKIWIMELPNPYFLYEYELTNPKEIEAVMDYLNNIVLRRRLIPRQVPAASSEAYCLTIKTNDGLQLLIWLDDNLSLMNLNRHYTVVKPLNYQELHEIIAGSPAWWHD